MQKHLDQQHIFIFGILLCRCFSQTRPICSLINQGCINFTHRSFYATTALVAHQLLIANKLDLFITSSYMNLTFSCATYRSLYLLSSESDLTLLYVLFQLSDKTSPSSQLLPKSYLFECLHPPIFANAFLISKVVSSVYQEGLNVTAVIDLFIAPHLLIYLVPTKDWISP